LGQTQGKMIGYWVGNGSGGEWKILLLRHGNDATRATFCYTISSLYKTFYTMKNTLIIFLLFLTYTTSFALSTTVRNDKPRGDTTAQDSINILYKELFKAFKIGYLYRKTVDWKAVEAETYSKLKPYKNFKASLNEITNLFDKINATHCLVYRGDDKYTVTKKVISKDLYSTQWRSKYDSEPPFEAKVLDEKYGYILIPGMVFFDNSAANMHRVAQPLYDKIVDIKTNHKIEGWIIDLRFNTGGNSTPMLLALYDFLGDHDIWGELNLNKRLVSKSKLKQGSYTQKSETIASINPRGVLLDQVKVALITGIFTGSSGEITALAFKGRPNTIFVGENTAGFTTGNVSWPLPYGTIMALTTGYDSDRNGNYYPFITPDVEISKQDNFDDLMADANIQEAIKFIRQE